MELKRAESRSLIRRKTEKVKAGAQARRRASHFPPAPFPLLERFLTRFMPFFEIKQ